MSCWHGAPDFGVQAAILDFYKLSGLERVKGEGEGERRKITQFWRSKWWIVRNAPKQKRVTQTQARREQWQKQATLTRAVGQGEGLAAVLPNKSGAPGTAPAKHSSCLRCLAQSSPVDHLYSAFISDLSRNAPSNAVVSRMDRWSRWLLLLQTLRVGGSGSWGRAYPPWVYRFGTGLGWIRPQNPGVIYCINGN